jgi:large subunit ribosomal protein L4
MHRAAMRSILSELLRQDRLVVVKDFGVGAPKTRELVEKLGKMGLDDVLIVTETVDENLELAARNLGRVGVLAERNVNPVSLIAFDRVLMTAPAVERLAERVT